MHPAQQDLAARVREQGIRHAVHQPSSQAPSAQLPRVRSLQSEGSWIDISSHNPSSSTTTYSAAGSDDTVTPHAPFMQSTDLPRRRPRRLHRSTGARTYTSNATYPTLITDSSQEEYEESESEQDTLLTSSNEDILQGPPSASPAHHTRRSMQRVPSSGSSDGQTTSSNEGGAGGQPERTWTSRLASSFHPQPNAFTHPPASRPANSYPAEPTSYFSTSVPMTRAASANAAIAPTHDHVHDYDQTAYAFNNAGHRASISSNTTVRQRSHTPYNIISPNHNVSVDHDAALRASLSTLLSCAAARRGLPKREASMANPLSLRQGQPAPQGTLYLIPESELDREEQLPETADADATMVSRATGGISDETLPAQQQQQQQKAARRKSKSKSPTRSPHSHHHHHQNGNKRQQRNAVTSTNDCLSSQPSAADLDSTSLSPTTLWFLGVGALFLGGAVLFTAGYIHGKEVGYVEGLSDASAASCRTEAAANGWRGMGRRSWRSASIWGVS